MDQTVIEYMNFADRLAKIKNEDIIELKIKEFYKESYDDFFLIESDGINGVDYSIKKTIELLNRSGYNTEYSCGGHYLCYSLLKYLYKVSCGIIENPCSTFKDFFDSILDSIYNSGSNYNNLYILFSQDHDINEIQILCPEKSNWFCDSSDRFKSISLRNNSCKTNSDRDSEIQALYTHLKNILSIEN